MIAPTLAFLGGSVGGWEMLVVGAVVLILFGPKALPEMARTIGKISAQLRGAAQDFRDQVTRVVEEEPPVIPPPTTPRSALPGVPAAETVPKADPVKECDSSGDAPNGGSPDDGAG